MSQRSAWQKILALIFLGGFFMLILYPYLALTQGLILAQEVIDIQKGVSSSLGPIAGSIVGYYYGTRRIRKSDSNIIENSREETPG